MDVSDQISKHTRVIKKCGPDWAEIDKKINGEEQVWRQMCI